MPTPEQQPQSTPEKNPLEGNPYRDKVEGFVADAPHFNTNQLSRFIGDHLMTELQADAEAGKFVTKRENVATGALESVTLSFDDILDHFQRALDVQDQPHDKRTDTDIRRMIPRANGLRDAVGAVMGNRRLAEPFRFAVYRSQAEQMKKRDMGEQAPVTPEQQALYDKAAEDMGEEATENSVELEAAAARKLVDIPQSKERVKDPYDYLREALPPTVRPEETPEEKAAKDKLYDAWIRGSDEDLAAAQGRKPDPRGFGHYTPAKIETATERQRKYYDTYVTEENRQDSMTTLVEAAKATPALKEILESHGLKITSIDAVDAIRENPDVRFEVAKTLLQKLDRLVTPDSDFGYRIKDNSPNNLKTDAKVNIKMQSRIYAVSLALKMLGGEFSTRGEEKDFHRGKDGVVELGQHRHAAQAALMTYGG